MSKIIFAVLALSLVVVFFFSLSTGPANLNDWNIIFQLRLPRALSALAVGGALAVAGVLLQAALSNPLADPYISGISSAAGFGLAIGVFFKLPLMPKISAAIFALATLFILTVLAKTKLKKSEQLLLLGIMVGYFFNAVTALILALSDTQQWSQILGWILGSFQLLTLQESVISSLLLFFFALASLFYWKVLDILCVDELLATTVGVNVEKYRLHIFVLVSIIVSICVSVAGLVGFVGLIVPHFLRRLGLTRHIVLIPSSFMLGGLLLLVSDLLSRKIIEPSELPVGVITAIVGAPCFFALLLGKSKKI